MLQIVARAFYKALLINYSNQKSVSSVSNECVLRETATPFYTVMVQHLLNLKRNGATVVTI